MSKEPHAIRIKSRNQFDCLLDHLVTETHRAWDHWNIWGGLDEAIEEYREEMNQAAQFWQLTIRAHKDSVVLRLGRLFDPAATALSFPTLLQTLHNAVHDPALQLLGLAPRGLDRSALARERRAVSLESGPVSRLTEVRNTYLAHRGAQLVGKGSFSTLPKLERKDLETLLKRARFLAEKYSLLYGRPTLALGYPGRDDYQNLLRLLSLGWKSIRSQHARELHLERKRRTQRKAPSATTP